MSDTNEPALSPEQQRVLDLAAIARQSARDRFGPGPGDNPACFAAVILWELLRAESREPSP